MIGPVALAECHHSWIDTGRMGIGEPLRYNSLSRDIMRALSRTVYRARGIQAAVYLLFAYTALACKGGAGGPGVEPPWHGDDIAASTSGTGGSGGTAGAREGAAGGYDTPASGRDGTGRAGSSGIEVGTGGGPAPTIAGQGGGVDLAGSDATTDKGAGGSVITGDAGSAQEPESTVGCRAPQEPGCGICCQELTDEAFEPSCIQKSATGDSDWFDSVERLDGPCPSDCEPCAACSLRDEQQLVNMEARPDCNCGSIDIGIDPCFAPMSCECYCQSYSALTETCPHLVQ